MIEIKERSLFILASSRSMRVRKALHPVVDVYSRVLAELPQAQSRAIVADLTVLARAAKQDQVGWRLFHKALFPQQREDFLTILAKDKEFSLNGLKFLRLLLRNGRLEYVDEIVKAYEAIQKRHTDAEHVDLFFCRSLHPDELSSFETWLSEWWGKRVSVTAHVDVSLGRGGVLFWSAYMLDFSLKRRMARCKAYLQHHLPEA